MKRCLLSLVMLVVVTSLARAHFIWIVPDKDGKSVQVVFSDTPKPDDPKLLAKIAKTEVFAPSGRDKLVTLKWTEGKEGYQVIVPNAGAGAIAAVCNYGVVEKGKAEPFLLKYHAIALVQPIPGLRGADISRPPGMDLSVAFAYGRTEAGEITLRFVVDFRGKPLTDAEVSLVPADGATKEVKSVEGYANLGLLKDLKPGVYGIRVRHVEAKEGELDGKKYKEVRHYATFTFRVAGAEKGAAADPPNADPAATKLLAEARAARALWKDFPGFSADIEVNFDGKAAKGKVHVSPEGKVKCEGLDKDYESWVRRQLGSIVDHRMDSGSPRDTPCTFTDDVKDHPLGRSIRVLNDELHSSYRIRGKEIVVVNRTMKDRRFTITVLESMTNAEGKYLTTSYVVDYWNLESGELLHNDAFTQTWVRVGKFDLPGLTRLIGASREKPAGAAGGDAEPGYSAKSLNLTNHKLLEAKK
jgi:Protein of unknown function (DUF3386)